jgi:DNA-binding helix-hairpin-helix protein with protein kinase domain
MPEMNELIGEQVEKRNYLTQDELSDPRILSDSRHVQTGGKRKRRKQREPRINESMDDGVAEKHTSKNFTPGRIRASRMRTNQNITDYTGKKDNYFKSPANQETEMFANAVD